MIFWLGHQYINSRSAGACVCLSRVWVSKYIAANIFLMEFPAEGGKFLEYRIGFTLENALFVWIFGVEVENACCGNADNLVIDI